jgi:hypothetical protein
VLVAWGFTEEGERVLLSVMLGMRESHEDWVALGRDLIARGLGAPLLIVADGASGLTGVVEQCWPASDRQHCAVHRVRNLLAKLPERERERIRAAYWQALDDATDERDGKQRLQGLVGELDAAGYTAAAKCLADDLDALIVHLRYPTTHRRRWRSTDENSRGPGHRQRLGVALACGVGVVDPGAKRRIWGFVLPRSLPRRGPRESRPIGGSHAPLLVRRFGLPVGDHLGVGALACSAIRFSRALTCLSE